MWTSQEQNNLLLSLYMYNKIVENNSVIQHQLFNSPFSKIYVNTSANQVVYLLALFSEVPMDLSEEESTPLVIRDRGGSQRSSSSTVPNLQVNLYFFPATKEATTLQITSGQISAENVCIQAGKKCGKTVMHYVLCKSLVFISHIHYCEFFSSRNLTGIPKSIWFGI